MSGRLETSGSLGDRIAGEHRNAVPAMRSYLFSFSWPFSWRAS